MKFAIEYLKQGKSVAVGAENIQLLSRQGLDNSDDFTDNTNADIEVRSRWIELASKHGVPIRCIHFTTPAEACLHNDVVRALNNSVSHLVFPHMCFGAILNKILSSNGPHKPNSYR
jgi:bifunctional polynucleotide phosphatase/kinase